MDVRTGEIYQDFNLLADVITPSQRKFYVPMNIPPTDVQMRRVPPKVGRNEPCPCGSGKKFKRCCMEL